MLIFSACGEGTEVQVAEVGAQQQIETESELLQETFRIQQIQNETDSEEIATEEVSNATESAVGEDNESTEIITEDTNSGISDMEVHFIDVGQGDATLIKADGHNMLIDAGENDKGTAVQLYLEKQGVEKLDYLVLTHTDSDHIGGADVIVTKFDIDTVFLGDYKKDNKTYNELISAFNYKGLTYSIPEVGSTYKLGNATFTIVAPSRSYSDPNNSSIALIVENGEDTFLFTGDCEETAERDILTTGEDIDCDVYKVGHHGSNTASSDAFLDAITPEYGVISCAEGNSYGHPHAEPLNNLRAMGVQVFRTDEQGSIVAHSDGTQITWNCSPSESWQVGENTQNAAGNTDEEYAGNVSAGAAGSQVNTIGQNAAEQKTSDSVAEESEPKQEPEVETVSEEHTSPGVHITDTGKKYHSAGCRYLEKSDHEVTLSDAKARGLTPCSKCNPPQ